MNVKIACLGALSRRPASGYDIRKLFETGPFGHFYEAGYGSIYPALADLARDGLAVVSEMPQDGKPDRKVYSITDAGLAVLVEELHEPPRPDRLRSEFLVTIFFAHLLPPAMVARFVDERLSFFRETLEHMRSRDSGHRPPGERFCHGFGMAVYQAAADFLAAERDRLLTALEAETHPAPAVAPSAADA